MDQENLGDLYSRLVTSSRLHQEMAGLLKFWLRGRRRFSSNIGPLSKVPFWCQVALTLIAGFAVTPANGYEVMMIVGGMSTLGGFSSYHRYCHLQFLIVPVIWDTSLWLFALLTYSIRFSANATVQLYNTFDFSKPWVCTLNPIGKVTFIFILWNSSIFGKFYHMSFLNMNFVKND